MPYLTSLDAESGRIQYSQALMLTASLFSARRISAASQPASFHDLHDPAHSSPVSHSILPLGGQYPREALFIDHLTWSLVRTDRRRSRRRRQPVEGRDGREGRDRLSEGG